MSTLVSDEILWTPFDGAQIEGHKVVVCKNCRRQLTGNRGAMRMHLRIKHNAPAAEVSSGMEPPPKKLQSDASTSELLFDTPTSKSTLDAALSKPVSAKPVSAKPVARDEAARNIDPTLPEKQAKDAIRYLALCAATPTAFRHAIDVLPNSSIRRIYDAVCDVASNGHAQASFQQSSAACATSI
jgi:hypothetical protein